MTPAEPAIELNGLEKTYRGKVHALRGVDLTVRKGEIFGLLGPNGAGKSTMVKILMTVIKRSKGKASLLGQPIGHKPTLARVGYLPEHHRFPPYLKGWQVLDFYGALSGIPRKTRKTRIDELLELVGMKDWGNKPLKGYSKGMRQRIGVAQALMNDPELVILDEPTDGVDPVGRRDIRDVCFRMRDEGRTVVLNSHLLSELEMVCSRVAILVQGRLRSTGTIDELVAGQERYEIEIAAADERARTAFMTAIGRDAPPADGAPPPPLALPSGEAVEISGSTMTAKTAEPETIAPVIQSLIGQGETLKAVRPHRPSLEDLFMQAVTDESGNTLAPGAKRSPKGAGS